MILSPSRVGIIVGLSNLRSMYGVDFLGIHTLLLFALIIILCVVSAIASEPSSAFPFVTLRQVLCEALATLNFECKPGWPCTYRDLAASLSLKCLDYFHFFLKGNILLFGMSGLPLSHYFILVLLLCKF